jgi:hypothetical protein
VRYSCVDEACENNVFVLGRLEQRSVYWACCILDTMRCRAVVGVLRSMLLS